MIQMRLLLQSLWLDIWKANGISVQSLGNHETAAKLFTEVGVMLESWKVLDKLGYSLFLNPESFR